MDSLEERLHKEARESLVSKAEKVMKQKAYEIYKSKNSKNRDDKRGFVDPTVAAPGGIGDGIGTRISGFGESNSTQCTGKELHNKEKKLPYGTYLKALIILKVALDALLRSLHIPYFPSNEVLISTFTCFIQIRIFATQSEYADRRDAAVESENHCKSQMQLLIDQISMQQGRIVALEEEKKRQDQECGQLRALVQDLERKGVQINKVQVPVAAVVVMACNRPDYLERTIESILKYQSSIASKYPLFVSQDGQDPNVKSKALSYKQLSYMQTNFSSLQHLDSEPVHTASHGELTAYYKIASHYKWALDELFYKHNFSRVILLEDDMEIAPDFFDYFEAAATLLDSDKSIMAVSSWNDNGQKQFVHDPKVLYRSDFFPGLGWMLTRSTWDELSPKWPRAYPCCLTTFRLTSRCFLISLFFFFKYHFP
ncbi:hypothetical protein HHK36_008812 [Tetracentron sinense]|uniref:Alpha-1,3-mannosyl-glycoprotein 2-beta-N-acetylglucosaminyltransferase n=1 Tax=Tetracentron sinense TaxID=13715 RepID=A0A834ZJQ6_TETSI|nr:hypothetical protein HHK36_008812 [Tetracentron sinense]